MPFRAALGSAARTAARWSTTANWPSGRVEAGFVVLPSFMLHYAKNLADHGFRVIADAIDVLTDLTARFLASYATHAISRSGLYANYLASRTQERVFLPQCCEIWATSPAEAEVLARIAPSVNVVVVANSLEIGRASCRERV